MFLKCQPPPTAVGKFDPKNYVKITRRKVVGDDNTEEEEEEVELRVSDVSKEKEKSSDCSTYKVELFESEEDRNGRYRVRIELRDKGNGQGDTTHTDVHLVPGSLDFEYLSGLFSLRSYKISENNELALIEAGDSFCGRDIYCVLTFVANATVPTSGAVSLWKGGENLTEHFEYRFWSEDSAPFRLTAHKQNVKFLYFYFKIKDDKDKHLLKSGDQSFLLKFKFDITGVSVSKEMMRYEIYLKWEPKPEIADDIFKRMGFQQEIEVTTPLEWSGSSEDFNDNYSVEAILDDEELDWE